MASTPWVMNERTARIWFSCLPCPSENFRSIPRFAASDLIDSELAVRHALSAPVWANPTLSVFFALSAADAAVASARQDSKRTNRGSQGFMVVEDGRRMKSTAARKVCQTL